MTIKIAISIISISLQNEYNIHVLHLSTFGYPYSVWWEIWSFTMMTSSNGNIFHWRRTLMFSLICIWTNGWVNNRNAGDLRRYCAHYDVTVKQAQENDTSNGWRSIFHNRWGTKTYACVHAQGPIRPNGIDRQQEINAFRQCYPSLNTSLTPAPAIQDGDKITGNNLKCNFVKVIVYFLYFLPWLFFLRVRLMRSHHRFR